MNYTVQKILMVMILSMISILCSQFTVSAQVLQNQDLSAVAIDNLSDSEIQSFYQKAKAANLSDAQVVELLKSRGLPATEIQKLQNRLKLLSRSTSDTRRTSQTDNANQPRDELRPGRGSSTFEVALDSFERRIFGMEIFNNPALGFEADLRLAPPSNYIVGPDDEVLINVYGYSDQEYRLTVNPDGNIIIPNVGPIYVNGLTLAAAQSKITQKLASTVYRAINTGQTKVRVTIGRPRTLKVLVIGQARKPGSYNVSSLATLFNVLYLCGGPTKEGSFRNIELVREGKVVKTVDLYQFLHAGDMSGNVSLRDNDVIRIPYYERRVKLDGAVKRPGYFEVQSDESLQRVFQYAGGFSDSAYRGQVRIFQVSGKERRISTIREEQFASYQPSTGDEIVIDKILDRFENRVQINGAVLRPGDYDLSDGLTLKQLIQKADGLKEDAYTQRASLSRLKEDQTRELIAFDVRQLLNGTTPDIPLKREDIVTIASLFDLRDELEIQVEGEVRKPGKIRFRSGMTIKDAILEAGGFTEAATGRHLEIGRRIVNAVDGKENTQIAEVINLDTDKDLGLTTSTVKLEPNDIIVVRNNPGYFVQRSVTIEGEVRYAGKYILSERNERISDIIARAGGFTNLADARAASLERVNRVTSTVDTALKASTLERLGLDTLGQSSTQPLVDKIGINLAEIMKSPQSPSDIILEDGDVIRIPKKDMVVKVRGEVLAPTQLSFVPGENLKDYVSRAGGFTDKANKKRSFVIASNGNAKRTKSFLFIKSYPQIEAGDEIYVPREPDRSGRGVSIQEVVGFASAMASLITIISLLK